MNNNDFINKYWDRGLYTDLVIEPQYIDFNWLSKSSLSDRVIAILSVLAHKLTTHHWDKAKEIVVEKNKRYTKGNSNIYACFLKKNPLVASYCCGLDHLYFSCNDDINMIKSNLTIYSVKHFIDYYYGLIVCGIKVIDEHELEHVLDLLNYMILLKNVDFYYRDVLGGSQ